MFKLMMLDCFSFVVNDNVFIIIIIRFNGRLCFIFLFVVIFVFSRIVVKNGKFMLRGIILVVVRNIVSKKLFIVIYF